MTSTKHAPSTDVPTTAVPSRITITPGDVAGRVIVTTPAMGVIRDVPADHRATTADGWYLGDGRGHVRDYVARGDGRGASGDNADVSWLCRNGEICGGTPAIRLTGAHAGTNHAAFPTFTVPRADGSIRGGECRACRNARTDRDRAARDAVAPVVAPRTTKRTTAKRTTKRAAA